MEDWPSRRDLEAAPEMGRAKASWGRGTIRHWRGEWYFLPDVGQPIQRVGGGYAPEDVLPAELLRVWRKADQLQFEGVA